MASIGFLKIDDIAGESRAIGHEDEVDIHDIIWTVSRSFESRVESRRRARPEVGELKLKKFVDAASPYLLYACAQGKSFSEIVLSVRKDSGEAHLDYLVITMKNVTISRFETVGVGDNGRNQKIEELIGLAFENVTYKYTVQEDDHSSGDEHEIAFDVASGV